MSSTYKRILPSPLGDLHCLAEDEFVVGVWYDENEASAGARLDPGHSVLQTLGDELGEYFAGQRKVFSVPTNPRGTEFQKSVWNELLKIPYGETRSYLDLATALGKANAVRAVGAANGRNPISVLVPCHRVIGNDGSLTGYAGGLHNKRWLLNHEGARFAGHAQLSLLG